jgi:hypothetical protein
MGYVKNSKSYGLLNIDSNLSHNWNMLSLLKINTSVILIMIYSWKRHKIQIQVLKI